MKCNCSVSNIVLSIMILVFVLWPNLLGAMYSKWVIVAASVLLIIHELWHKHHWIKNSAPISSKAVNKKRK